MAAVLLFEPCLPLSSLCCGTWYAADYPEQYKSINHSELRSINDSKHSATEQSQLQDGPCSRTGEFCFIGQLYFRRICFVHLCILALQLSGRCQGLQHKYIEGRLDP